MKRILFRVFFIIFLAFVLPVAATHYKNMAETTEKIWTCRILTQRMQKMTNLQHPQQKMTVHPAEPSPFSFMEMCTR